GVWAGRTLGRCCFRQSLVGVPGIPRGIHLGCGGVTAWRSMECARWGVGKPMRLTLLRQLLNEQGCTVFAFTYGGGAVSFSLWDIRRFGGGCDEEPTGPDGDAVADLEVDDGFDHEAVVDDGGVGLTEVSELRAAFGAPDLALF